MMILWIITGVILVAVIAFVVFMVIKFCQYSNEVDEERRGE